MCMAFKMKMDETGGGGGGGVVSKRGKWCGIPPLKIGRI